MYPLVVFIQFREITMFELYTFTSKETIRLLTIKVRKMERLLEDEYDVSPITLDVLVLQI